MTESSCENVHFFRVVDAEWSITPMEAWKHEKPDVSSFRVFGSLAWELIPDENTNPWKRKVSN